MLDVRKLIAIDMSLNGTKFIVGEFIVGVLGLCGFGALSFAHGQELMGWWLTGMGVNYAPLLYFSIVLARSGTARQEASYELEHRREIWRYSLWQFLILLPFVFALIALVQGFRKR